MVSAFELFRVGVGPSSSHTVGPMRAAADFVRDLAAGPRLGAVGQLQVVLLGSLAHSGRGHRTDVAVIAGLAGERPESTDAGTMDRIVDDVRRTGCLTLDARHGIPFDLERDLRFDRATPPGRHPNALRLIARWDDGSVLADRTYYSVGGGFVATATELDAPAASTVPVPLPFGTGAELLQRCDETGLSISGVVLRNEMAVRSEAEVRSGLLALADEMRRSAERGMSTGGVLPGGLGVRRRAAERAAQLGSPEVGATSASGDVVDRLCLVALAVNEENAAGGRIVTAPTNGAAGVVPAALDLVSRGPGGDDRVVRFLLAAAAVGALCKANASISGAEVGCQGEIGSACGMAAAGLAEAWGGTPRQVENAAEIGIEHNLGLTCDPVGGLVQVPCIERNTVAAVHALTAARLALHGNGQHVVSLDAVLRTLRQTGKDMGAQYKETSLGGLAVNVVEC